MKEIIKLKNPVKNYGWGTCDFIPNLLNVDNTEQKPFAELWMSTHKDGLSLAVSAVDDLASGILTDVSDKSASLAKIIKTDKEYFLGKKIAKKNDELPYLFKVLSAESPLSIQAHPNRKQAEAGFMRENATAIPIDADERNYKDNNHKPEIMCALTNFQAMCGFRKLKEIIYLLKMFDCPLTNKLMDARTLKSFFTTLFSLKNDGHLLNEYIEKNTEAIEKKFQRQKQIWELIKKFNKVYPNDIAVIAPLYLNIINLKPREAFFVPAGIMHAYVKGSGIELMAACNNVLRGGLTSKYIDETELCNVLIFKPYRPKIIACNDEYETFLTYKTKAKDFVLSRLKNFCGSLPIKGPVIMIITNGNMLVTIKHLNKNLCRRAAGYFCSPEELHSVTNKTLELKTGESIFIADKAPRKNIILKGNYTAFAAGV
ncbi:MAG: mannose-6-phosphate isomerase, class I [Termitinemataceae bacterium]|nr:MAG: mannose-6-phosphate isomerase, class I [Termitinemataceae bacterium]